MKSFLFWVCTLVLSVQTSHAQYDCTNGRFIDEHYFDSVKVTSSILYGQNMNVSGTAMQSLYLDFFEPYGDTMLQRPLIIFAFGGSFVTGDRAQVYDQCKAYAAMGYAVASIDYRVGYFFPVNQTSTAYAVLRGTHDMKSAIRFFKKDVLTSNAYKVDTNMFIIGGISSGAISSLHAVFLDQDQEFPAYLDSAFVGGIEGNSGNLGYYSGGVKGILNFSGAIGDTSWIHLNNKLAIYSVHDTGDAIVPFKTEEVMFGGVFPTGLIASGSADVHARMLHTDGVSNITIYNTTGHVTYFSDTANQALIFNESVQFMENNLVCKYALGFTNDQVKLPVDLFILFPNPTEEILTIKNNINQETPYTMIISDLQGRLVLNEKMYVGNADISLASFSPGTYMARILMNGRYFHYSFVKK